MRMIRSIKDSATRQFVENNKSRFSGMDVAIAHRRLRQINTASSLQALAGLNSVGLHKLKGYLRDFWSVDVNAGWRILFVPGALAVHHDQLGTDAAAMRRRIVEFHRNRDLYFRKHGMHLTRLVWKACWIWAYLVRAAAATLLPGRDPRRYLLHARQELLPGRGEGIREAAEAHNRGLAQ